MKAVFLVGAFFWSITTLAGLQEVPRVPSSMEVAGVKLKLTSEAQEIIQQHVDALRASEKYFLIKLDRVNLYFPIIERVLREENVPEDFKYLAVQESSLISDAVSSADAVGYWQFKDFTAREVGLRVDNKVDERKNIVASTQGAAKYFKRNNYFFQNWIYSVSAYQAGPAGAKRYVDPKNYGSDKLEITKNTHWYVLKFLAHYIAFNDEVGEENSQGLRLTEYVKGGGKTLGEIANEVKVETALVEEYNKWLRHGKVPEDKTYTVIIPKTGKLPKPTREESAPPPLTRSIPEPEIVTYPDQLAEGLTKKTILFRINGIEAVMAGTGDNVVNLAMKSGISGNRLIRYNDLKEGQSIVPGEIYYTKSKRNKSPIRFHIVSAGESAWDISQKYGIKLKKLAKKNRMKMTDPLRSGRIMWLGKKRPKKTPIEYYVPEVLKDQKVKTTPILSEERNQKTTPEVPKPTPTPPPPTVVDKPDPKPVSEPEPVEKEPSDSKEIHLVADGETIWSISRMYGMTAEELLESNNLNKNSILSINQKLRVSNQKSLQEEPKINKPTKSSEGSSEIHRVAEGETLWQISINYGVSLDELKEWNDLDGQAIYPGQELNISRPEKIVFYTVKPGDSLYKIAQLFDLSVDDLKRLNQLESDILSVGDQLKVPPEE